MPAISEDTTEPPTHGCPSCKAQRTYTVEHFDGGNVGWRCMACGTMVNLIPGNYRAISGLAQASPGSN